MSDRKTFEWKSDGGLFVTGVATFHFGNDSCSLRLEKFGDAFELSNLIEKERANAERMAALRFASWIKQHIRSYIA